jgi:hypothetical protein
VEFTTVARARGGAAAVPSGVLFDGLAEPEVRQEGDDDDDRADDVNNVSHV